MAKIPKLNEDLGGSGADLGDIGKGIGGGLGGGLDSLDDSKFKKAIKYTLIAASIIGIVSAVFIFIQILSIDPGFEVPIGVEKLGIIAGICAFITGLDTLVNIFRKRSAI